MIGAGWLVHALWDVLNFGAGHALVDGNLMTNFGCAIFDPLIAVWFFLGAPSVTEFVRYRFMRGEV